MSDLDFGVRDLTGLIRNFHAADPVCVAAMKKVTRRSGGRAYDTAQELCPVDKGNMKELMRLDFTPDDLYFELGWSEADFEVLGLRFYPEYPEFGTSKMDAQPCVTPAFFKEEPQYKADMAQEVRASLERMRVPL